ncbi:hypothetical protein BDAP_000093 [Binucleata daphniae]
MNVNFDINESKEVNYNVNNKTTKKRRKNDDYDYEDSMIEPEEGDCEGVELECHIKNFFVFAGTLEDEGAKVLKKYTSNKKYNRKTATKSKEIQKNENKQDNDVAKGPCMVNDKQENIKDSKIEETININKKEAECVNDAATNNNEIQNLENKTQTITDSSTIQQNINKANADCVTENKTSNTDSTYDSIISKSYSFEKDNELNVKNKEVNEYCTAQNNVTVQKRMKQFTLNDEYTMKNIKIMQENQILDTEKQTEVFLNDLVCNTFVNNDKFYKKYKIEKDKLESIAKYEKMLNDIEIERKLKEFKIEEMAKEKITNNVFYDLLWQFTDLNYKTIALHNFIHKKDKMSIATMKKEVQNRVEEILQKANNEIKNWSSKLYKHKKKALYEKYMHLLN